MPEIMDRTPKPRGTLPRGIWVMLIVALLVVVLPFVASTLVKSGKRPALSQLQSAQLPSAGEVRRIADSLMQKRAQPLAVPQQQVMTVPQVVQPAQPSVRQEDPAAEENKRKMMEERLQAPMAPIFGVGSSQASVSSGQLPAIQGVMPGLLPNPAQVQQTAALMAMNMNPYQTVQGMANMPNAKPAGLPPHAGPLAAGTAPVIATSANNPFVVPDGAFNQADGQGYFVPEGTLLRCTLENKLDGQFDAPLWCDLAEPLMSFNGQRTLIPVSDPTRQGKITRLEGESKRVEAWGQTRLGIFFKKLYMPDGYEVWFSEEQVEGLDSSGAAGLHGHVNNHILSSFGASLAIGLLGAAGELGTGPLLTERGAGRLEEGAAMGMSMSSMQILGKFLNRMPTITVPPGTKIQVYLAANYAVPEYSKHHMPSDF